MKKLMRPIDSEVEDQIIESDTDTEAIVNQK